MKYYYRIFILGCLLATATIEAKAQQIMSVLADFSPSTSTLIGSASRIGYDDNFWSTFYMRYNDNSYFCCNYFFSFWSPSTSVAFSKITMPQDFIITDFKRFLDDPNFIGSYQGVGMFGKAYYYNLVDNNYLRVIKLPEVNQLNRVAVAHPLGSTAIVGMKSFAIGEKTEFSKTMPHSYILEYYMIGSATYQYAPLAYDPVFNKQEIADDVITLGNYVIYATRDTRPNHAPVNLRISDTNNVLSSNTAIDYQWQFLLHSNEVIRGEVRLIPVDKGSFVVAYTMFKLNEREYYLCVHRIELLNLLTEQSCMISHEIKIDGYCSDLTDVIFKPDVGVFVALLNGNGKSRFYHLDPFAYNDGFSYRTDYSNGNFYSMDTLENNSSGEIMYMAMGDSVIMLQNISNGINIVQSCLEKTKQKSILREPLPVHKNYDPINRYTDYRLFDDFYPAAPIFFGTRTCKIINTNE